MHVKFLHIFRAVEVLMLPAGQKVLKNGKAKGRLYFESLTAFS